MLLLYKHLVYNKVTWIKLVEKCSQLRIQKKSIWRGRGGGGVPTVHDNKLPTSSSGMLRGLLYTYRKI